jgi:hypothetical protein
MNEGAFKRFVLTMKMRGLLIPRLLTIDMIRHHSRGMSGETRKHFYCKCICSKVLYDAQHIHFTEYEFPNGVVADVFDATEFVAIEFETDGKDRKEQLKLVNYQTLIAKQMIRDVFVFNISSMPDDWLEIERIIRKRLGV